MATYALYDYGTENVAWEVNGGTKQATQIKINGGGGTFTHYAITSTAVDLTDAETIEITYSYNNSSKSKSLDVSSYTGSYYISFTYLTDSSHHDVHVGLNATKAAARTIQLENSRSANTELSMQYMALEIAASSYTVVFYDGSGNSASQVIQEGVPTALESPFSKSNYRLRGWDTSSSGTTVVYTPGQTVTDIAQSGQSIGLYAVWRKAWAYIVEDDSGDYYTATQTGMTQTLIQLSGVSALTASVFYGQGFQFIPNSTILKTLTNPKVYLWADDALPDLSATVEAVPLRQQIKTEVDLSAAYITGIKEFEITYTGDVTVGYTYDGNPPVSSMSVSAFLALDPDNIYAGLSSSKKLYVFFYLEDEDAVLTRFITRYKRRAFH